MNYLDVDNAPVYPFGYGLSYTTFEYSDVTLSASEMTADGSITAQVTVTNTGDREGKEIAQLYIRDMVGSITRPIKELKGFEKIALAPGESKTVSFEIDRTDLEFFNYNLEKVVEPGEFKIFIGKDSQTTNEATLIVK